MTGSVKKSQFSAWGDNALPAGGYIDFTYNGTNYKMSLANFVSQLGVSGSIVQVGDSLAAPVLKDSGTVKGIRNILGGFGLAAEVQEDDTLQVDLAVSYDDTGVALVSNPSASETDAAPAFRSLVAGSGISIAGAGGVIQISNTETPASTKTIVVNQLTDLPEAVGTVITLEADTEYAFRNDINLGVYTLVLGDNCVLSGSDEAVVTLSYTGAGTMLTCTNGTAKARHIALSCPSGTLLSFSGTGTEILQLLDVTINANLLGSIGGFAGLQISGLQVTATAGGFTLTGSNGVALTRGMLATIGAGTLFDLGTATFSGISYTDCFVTLNGASKFLSGLAASGNLNTGSLGSVHNSRFFGTGTVLDTITVDDVQWQFYGNDDLQDTEPGSVMSLVSNATTTVIAAVSTPVKIAGTWNDELKSHFLFDSSGRATYKGIKPQSFTFTGVFTASLASGSPGTDAFYLAKNGTVITNSAGINTLSNAQPTQTAVTWELTLDPDDYLEVFVENRTDSVDILVSDAVMRIH